MAELAVKNQTVIAWLRDAKQSLDAAVKAAKGADDYSLAYEIDRAFRSVDAVLFSMGIEE